MNEMPDSLLATDEPPSFTVDNENGTSPLLIVADHAGKHFPRGLDSSAFPMPNASVTLPGTSASARFAA
jgi:predicted N-formylglutamate amidohydrolase